MKQSLRQKLQLDFEHILGKSSLPKIILSILAKKNCRIVFVYRILNHYKKSKWKSYLLLPLHMYYRLMCNRYCIDLPPETNIEPGFKLNHAQGIVVYKKSTIGNNVYISHNVTIGSNGVERFPTIGNNVTIYTGSVIIGNVKIGDNVVIGANSLVIKDIPENSVVVGTPCKLLIKKS